jgi:hypothetical protein
VLVQAAVLHVFGGDRPTGRTVSRFSLSLAAGAPGVWTETTNALPYYMLTADMLSGV